MRLIKSFSNDLELPSEFEISLNEDEVLDEVLDLMLNSIGENGNAHLTKLLKSYAKSNFKDGNQWNFKRQLMSFSSSLSKEKNKVFIQTLKDLSFDQKEYKAVQDRINELNKEFVSTILPFAELFYALNINDQDLPYKSQTLMHYKKLPKRRSVPFIIVIKVYFRVVFKNIVKRREILKLLRESLKIYFLKFKNVIMKSHRRCLCF